MDSSGQNTGVGSRSLLQGIFPTQGSNPGLLHCRRILYHLKREVAQSCPTLCESMDCVLPGLSVHGIFQARVLESGLPFPSPGDLPDTGIEPRSPTLQADSLPVKPQGKPKNTGVGSLSLLQWIFWTQESNWGLPHYRQILYQLSHQG